MGERIVDYQDGAFGLTRLLITQADEALMVEMDWESSSQASGDYRFFLHVYADLDQPPVAQYDAYLVGAPVGSWPHHLSERVHLSLSDVPAGTYHVALGFYNPVSLERLHPVSSAYQALPDGRLLLDMVELPPDE